MAEHIFLYIVLCLRFIRVFWCFFVFFLYSWHLSLFVICLFFWCYSEFVKHVISVNWTAGTTVLFPLIIVYALWFWCWMVTKAVRFLWKAGAVLWCMWEMLLFVAQWLMWIKRLIKWKLLCFDSTDLGVLLIHLSHQHNTETETFGGAHRRRELLQKEPILFCVTLDSENINHFPSTAVYYWLQQYWVCWNDLQHQHQSHFWCH